jgi:glucokinase
MLVEEGLIAVFDLGGTWFRWGLCDPVAGLSTCQRVPAINYLSHPDLTATQLQGALVDFVLLRVRELRATHPADLSTVGVSIGAPLNAHDGTVLGSGPLWGPSGKAFRLRVALCDSMPELDWHVVNDITALLAPYMDDTTSARKTMLITVSSGIGSRLYDHRASRIPYDAKHGLQGEIGHLVSTFTLDGRVIERRCECGGLNHVNAFSSGRGLCQTLRDLPSLTARYGELCSDAPAAWRQASDEYRLTSFRAGLQGGQALATGLLDAFVTPLSRVLSMALCLDPEIDRIIMTGGVAHGLGTHYRQALQRVFLRDGLYKITDPDPEYLQRRLHWHDADDFAGLRGAGLCALRNRNERMHAASSLVSKPGIPAYGSTPGRN